MVATACLYHLVRGELSKMMHVGLLADMVQLVLHAIEISADQPVHFQVVTSVSSVIHMQSTIITHLELVIAYYTHEIVCHKCT